MNLEKLNPWNWFKHEESADAAEQHIAVKNNANDSLPVQYQATSRPIMQFHQELDRMFDDVFSGFGVSPLTGRSNALLRSDRGIIRPNLNISSDDKNYLISLEVPGFQEADISIEVKGDVLTIQGHIEDQKEEKDQHFYRMERSYGTIKRVLSLPDDADADNIEALMKDGVLSLTIPRQEVDKADTKTIPISHTS